MACLSHIHPNGDGFGGLANISQRVERTPPLSRIALQIAFGTKR
jgi:hypothetical protein